MVAMRRKDRQVSDEEAMAYLKAAEYGVLSTVGPDGEPYGVPLTYAVEEDGNLTAFHIPQCCVFRPLSVKATHHADPARRRLQTPFIQFVILHFLPLRCAQPIGKCLPGGRNSPDQALKKQKPRTVIQGFSGGFAGVTLR